VAVNIKFYYTLIGIGLAVAAEVCYQTNSFAAGQSLEDSAMRMPVEACVVARETPLSNYYRAKFAQCIGWESALDAPTCGSYQALQLSPLPNEDEIRIMADEVSLYAEGRSQLKGNVEIRESQRMVNAQTAYIYRDAKTNKVTKIELLDGVRYIEPDRMMIARKGTINPQDKSGEVEDVLYRFNNNRAGAILPAWGRASLIKRFANQDYLLRLATYTTCRPQDKAWQIEAREIKLDNAKGQGVARSAVLRVGDVPVLYSPYLSFPTTHKRKSGFLMPQPGYSNVGGFDLALPYYWNIAPNYDATIIPHLYTLRGMMMGGNFRFLTPNSTGMIGGHFLPHDKAFGNFITSNESQFPNLAGTSNDRWSFLAHDSTVLTDNLHMNVNYRQVSDDYYLQDFSSNLEILTENQLLRQGDVVYNSDHWVLSGMLQSYQTLHPINQSPISDIYERLPQLRANTFYYDLPMGANFNMVSEYDNFRWPAANLFQPEGPRYHLNPSLSLPLTKPWGYITPNVQLVENYYDVHYIGNATPSNSFNRSIPRYNIDSGLTFERPSHLMGQGFTQTLEPRLFYLKVPFQNQTPIPVYDSAYMIFNTDQLFRMNRFSGFDRIGDTNQLSYALTSRWLSDYNGQEKASLSVGQIRYFANRQVQLCYDLDGNCVDTPLYLGYLSPFAKTSPIASRGMYQINRTWRVSSDYVWDTYTHSTNNGNLNFHYEPEKNHIINVGYTYLVNGNLLQNPNDVSLNGNLVQAPTGTIQDNSLHQATAAYAWPLSERWSSIGAYSYNISKGYGMMTFVGFQYDNCCWAVRLIGGRTFQSLSPDSLSPRYNNNVYIQILLKGLGSVATSNPSSTINSYLPTYRDMF
jgi:LPS-assembly protein